MWLSPNYESVLVYISKMFTYFNPPDTFTGQTLIQQHIVRQKERFRHPPLANFIGRKIELK